MIGVSRTNKITINLFFKYIFQCVIMIFSTGTCQFISTLFSRRSPYLDLLLNLLFAHNISQSGLIIIFLKF